MGQEQKSGLSKLDKYKAVVSGSYIRQLIKTAGKQIIPDNGHFAFSCGRILHARKEIHIFCRSTAL